MKITYKILASLLLIATLGACMGDKNPSDGEVEDKNPLVEEKSEDENKTEEQVSEEKEEEAENTEDVASTDLDADKVLDEMLDASKNLKKLHSNTTFTIDDREEKQTQVMDGEGEFDPETGEVLNGKYSITNSDGSYQIFDFVGDEEGSGYLEEGHADGSMTKETSTGGGYFISPNYFELVKMINSMKGDLDIKEEGDSYRLSLKSQNTDLLGLFKEQFSIEFTNFDQHETEKDFEILIDKESKLLTDLKLSFEIEDEERGYLYIEVLSKFDKFEFK